ncbi:hypothetical protein [Gillisia sp. CAL575]|uniref:hypothetical protein n=1 Tax=Gillisia sp. CAL575 TaxID=985255 RepID=UPI00039E992F|nr:hypothetical protein [Gillisia sp. CAL575]
MRKIILLLTCLFSAFGIQAQDLNGAWQRDHTSKDGDKLKSVVIISDGYQVISTYNSTTGEFIGTNGGTLNLTDDIVTEKVEFDSKYPERVGIEESFKVSIKDSLLGIIGTDIKYIKLDNGSPGKLQGAWLMSGRTKDGESQSRDTSGPRKTMKILSGTRFQWIAYNTETKQFMGTGGGTYTTSNGEYTENIEFFSKDNTKVGKSLTFNYNLSNGDWQHSGLSSKGDPINETWSIRE